MSRLYIVSTPIGNLGDFTHRGEEVLSGVSRILAEDTRRTGVLLRHYGIRTRMVSLHAYNEVERASRILEWLAAGEELALVSDAGTPLLSDPGARIVRKVVEAGYEVVPVPGASALLASLVASGLDPEPFTFYGFLPRGGRRRRELLDTVARLDHTAVLYEAPGRLVALLDELAGPCGPDRRVVVAREVTKLHEEFRRGTLAEVAAYYRETPPRGEIVVMVAGRAAPADAAAAEGTEAQELARTLLSSGMRPSAAARELAKRLGTSRNRAYDVVQAILKEVAG
ncbi:MAG TPA: 16S rRNA (cytidine(1402)-2'-O)-methyltransferase [Longimicrobiales bacterium]|nr:16S rRNA (cytidine(1402)-2'-O)-methyltransferase [Longimicrobiales bacterium]